MPDSAANVPIVRQILDSTFTLINEIVYTFEPESIILSAVNRN
jgi:hypothetical protein